MDQRKAMTQALDSYLKSGLSRRALMRAGLAAGGLAAMAPFAASAGSGGSRTLNRASNQEAHLGRGAGSLRLGRYRRADLNRPRPGPGHQQLLRHPQRL